MPIFICSTVIIEMCFARICLFVHSTESKYRAINFLRRASPGFLKGSRMTTKDGGVHDLQDKKIRAEGVRADQDPYINADPWRRWGELQLLHQHPRRHPKP